MSENEDHEARAREIGGRIFDLMHPGSPVYEAREEQRYPRMKAIIAAALRAAEESAARRCAEIVSSEGRKRGQRAMGANIAAAIRAEFGLGEEAGDV